MKAEYVIAPYEEHDFLRVKLLREAEWLMGAESATIRWKNILAASHVRTIYCDMEIAAVVGLLWFYPRSAEAFMLASPAILRNPYRFLLRIEELLQYEMNPKGSPCRVQAMCRTQWPGAARFLQKLGFKREGTMQKFGFQSEDMDMYARVA